MIIKKTKNEELPDHDVVAGRQRIARYEYAAVRPEVDDTDITEWLNKNAVEGWTLISVDQGMYYFRREEYCLYYEVDGRLVRSRLGENS